MILGGRQAMFGAVAVPEISRWEAEINFSGNWLSLRNSLVKALEKKYHSEYFSKIEDCVSQSLNFLIILGATKELNKKIESIELWDKLIQLTPLYEGINIQLDTMLVKHHCPHIYEEMSKGHIYSHWTLTVIKNCVSYTLELLHKEELLKDDIELLERENVKKWLSGEEK